MGLHACPFCGATVQTLFGNWDGMPCDDPACEAAYDAQEAT